MKFTISILICILLLPNLTISEEFEDGPSSCSLKPKLVQEIKKYQLIADKITEAIIHGEFKGLTYNNLVTFVDKFGPRFTGSKNLEDSIDYLGNEMRKMGLENVRHEMVSVPHWVRGAESATLIEPRHHNIRMLGLGTSVGTKKAGIKAEAIVVNDFDELKRKGNSVKGKIVVYNQKYITYKETVQYRLRGASEASKLGAVAALIRSITPFSLNTPHTGEQRYEQNVTPIPVACITSEDAHMLRRMQNRGKKLTIHLKMEARNLDPTESRNTIAELTGNKTKDKFVLMTGHIDSWDVGQGAMDDGGGAFISWMSLVVLKRLGLRPRRTLLAALLTAEEIGLFGAEQYVKAHSHELDKFNFVMESDAGTFWPTGLAVTGTNKTICIVKEILKLLKPIGATTIKKGNLGMGPDISHFLKRGVPGASLLNKNSKYFIFHHTESDTVDVENPKALDYCTAVFATVSYIIADLSVNLPKHNLHDKD